MKTKLTVKQEEFIREYFKHFTAVRAYRTIYGNVKGAESAAARLLVNVKVKERIKEIKAERAENENLDRGFVLDYLVGAATLEIDDFMSATKNTVTVKDLTKIPSELKKYITGVKPIFGKSGKAIQVKFFSKEKALDLLAKYTGVAVENLNLKADVKVNSIVDLVNNHSE